MGASDSTKEVMGGVHVGHPVAHCVVDCVFERPRSSLHGDDLRAEESHPGNIEGLSLSVDFTHVHNAAHTHQRGGGRGGNAVLARPCLRDQAGLAKPLGE